MGHLYTDIELDFIKNHAVGRSKRDLTHLFNLHFQQNLSERQIISCCKNHKFPSSGLNGRFKPGHTPFNKGKKGLYQGGKLTHFKKGQLPYNYRPVGSERVNVNGYLEIKVADPNKWCLKHIIFYEETIGPIPKGFILIFLDGNKQNISLENLQLVTRKQLVRLNQKHLITDNPELTKTGIIIADIYNKIGERQKVNKT